MSPPIPILHQDAHLLVAAKPAGMLSVPTPGATGNTLEAALRAQGLPVLAVHRLDRETSGVMLFALDETTRAALDDMFRARSIEKTYWALASGRVQPAQGSLRFPILEEKGFARVSSRGKLAHTRYRTLVKHPNSTEVEVDLLTGRYNQIRLHFAHAGFPLVGERKYARGKDSAVRIRSRRVALHAWKLGFAHPRTGKRVEAEAPLPEDLLELCRRAADPRDATRSAGG